MRGWRIALVPKVGLGPTRLSTPAFEAGASAYFAISAYNALGFTPLLSGVTGYKTWLSKALIIPY